MKILNLVQGTKAWLEVRLSHFTASEAPAMMGTSKYMSRAELLTLKKTGVSKPVDNFTQKIFDSGHAAEESARVFAELEWFAELKPLVGAITVDGLPLLASFDGIDDEHTVVWEHKLFNQTLFENVRNDVLEACYYWQLEHQMLVADIEEIMFTCSDGTEENSISMVYRSQPERRAQLIAGWKQFAIDLENHEVKAKEEKLVAKEMQALPKLEVSLIGNVSNSNLAEYKGTALAFIQSINTDLQSDQDFVDAEKAVKFFTNGEKELEAVKERALSDTADIKTLFDTIDELKEEMRQKRLTLTKLVKTRKEEIRSDISFKAKTEFSSLLISTSKNLNGIQITQVVADFDGVMKGKKTVESLQNAVDTELARCKIALSEIAELVHTNLNLLTELASEHKFLFNDYAQIVFKDNEDLTNLIKSRIAEHEEAEAARKQREQEQMQAEANAKAEREAQARINAETERARKEEREKLVAEQAQKATEETQQKTDKEVSHTVSDKTVSLTKTKPTPTKRDISHFLTTLHESSLDDFGYLLISNDPKFEQEALANIKATFQAFLADKAA